MCSCGRKPTPKIQDGVPEWRSFKTNRGSDVQGRTIFIVVCAQCVCGHMCRVVHVSRHGRGGHRVPGVKLGLLGLCDKRSYSLSHWASPLSGKSSPLHSFCTGKAWLQSSESIFPDSSSCFLTHPRPPALHEVPSKGPFYTSPRWASQELGVQGGGGEMLLLEQHRFCVRALSQSQTKISLTSSGFFQNGAGVRLKRAVFGRGRKSLNPVCVAILCPVSPHHPICRFTWLQLLHSALGFGRASAGTFASAK